MSTLLTVIVPVGSNPWPAIIYTALLLAVVLGVITLLFLRSSK